MLRIAIAQMSTTNNLEANLARMRAWVEQAAKQKAQLVCFPEMAYFMGTPAQWQPLLASYPEIVEEMGSWARTYGIHLLPGSLREPVKGATNRYFNTELFIDPTGTVLAKYRKLFLFKAVLPDRTYDESEHSDAGNMVVTCDRSLGTCFGFSICFDLRFPEVFRALRRRGAQVVFLPSAFTVPTGKAHWEPLIRARAIENQLFMIAPAQTGHVGEGNDKYGHSLVVAPWGEVLKDMGEPEGLAVCEIDLAAIGEAERRVSAWACRREELFPFG